jgi:hypothetical protein
MVTFRLHQDVENNAMLIDGSPEVVSNAIDLEKHLIQMPFVTSLRTAFPQARCESLPELFAPAPHRFIADQNAARRH